MGCNCRSTDFLLVLHVVVFLNEMGGGGGAMTQPDLLDRGDIMLLFAVI